MLYKHGHRSNPDSGSATTPSIGSIIQSQSASTTKTYINNGISTLQYHFNINENF